MCTSKMSLIPSALPKVLRVMTAMACRWIVGIVKTLLKNDAMEPEEIANI